MAEILGHVTVSPVIRDFLIRQLPNSLLLDIFRALTLNKPCFDLVSSIIHTGRVPRDYIKGLMIELESKQHDL